MEDLFRQMRSVEADRASALKEFADLLIAHALAEEAEVYPALKRYQDIDDEEVEHGEEEHEEGNKALLALLEVDEIGSDEWDEKLEEPRGGHRAPHRRGGADHPQRGAGERRHGAPRRTRRGLSQGAGAATEVRLRVGRQRTRDREELTPADGCPFISER